MSVSKIERRDPIWVTPEYEDAGLFRTGLSRVRVDLIPDLWQNSRGDLVVRGFVEGGKPICVIFAGRRKAEARSLLARLRTMQANASLTHAETSGERSPSRWQRVPVLIEGAWRRIIVEDEDGWPTRQYHFMAARWMPVEGQQEGQQFGIAPAIFE